MIRFFLDLAHDIVIVGLVLVAVGGLTGLETDLATLSMYHSVAAILAIQIMTLDR